MQSMLEVILKYWSQVAVLLGLIGYILKLILDYRIRGQELRNKYFYELKAKKLIELHEKIVEIKMTVDRKKYDTNFKSLIFTQRMSLDKFFWESKFYFGKKTQKIFGLFLRNLLFFEVDDPSDKYPDFESDFDKINEILLREFKNEIL